MQLPKLANNNSTGCGNKFLPPKDTGKSVCMRWFVDVCDVVFSTREGVSEENIRVIKEQVEMRCPVASMIKCSNTRLICGVRNEVIEDAVVEDAVIEDAVIRDA